MAIAILAHDLQYGIGKGGKIPWDILLDKHFFHDMTTKSYTKSTPNLLIMGKRTYLSLGNIPLGNRVIIVVSTTLLRKETEWVWLVPSITAALELSKTLPHGQIFICGGKEIYRESMEIKKLINTVYVTQIEENYDCDVHVDFLPHYLEQYHKVDEKSFTLDSKVKLNFLKYEEKEKKNKETAEHKYTSLIYDILTENDRRVGRNGTTLSVFARTLSFNLSEGFPLLTTKSVFFRAVVEELIFFLHGSTNTKLLEKKGINIWKENTNIPFLRARNLPYDEGDMGPMYGFNWIHYGESYKGMDVKYEKGINQIDNCLNKLRTKPYSRDILMTTFNPLEAPNGVLYPCHGIHIQFYVDQKNHLSCLMTQRSADVCCGLPFNIASYALLVHLFCNVLEKYTPGRLTIMCADTHIYEEHIRNAMRQSLREPYPFPTLRIKKKLNRLNEIEFQDIELLDYKHHGSLRYLLKA